MCSARRSVFRLAELILQIYTAVVASAVRAGSAAVGLAFIGVAAIGSARSLAGSTCSLVTRSATARGARTSAVSA